MPSDTDGTHSNAFERFTREVVERLTRIEERLENRAENHADLKVTVGEVKADLAAARAELATERDRLTKLSTQMTIVYGVGGTVGGALVVAMIGIAARVFGH